MMVSISSNVLSKKEPLHSILGRSDSLCHLKLIQSTDIKLIKKTLILNRTNVINSLYHLCIYYYQIRKPKFIISCHFNGWLPVHTYFNKFQNVTSKTHSIKATASDSHHISDSLCAKLHYLLFLSTALTCYYYINSFYRFPL